MDSQRSMLDVVRESLRASNRTTFVHRMIYIGGHTFEGGLEEFVRGLISIQAEQWADEPLTGFLLSYPTHFLHLVEGSENTLIKHLRALVDGDLPEAEHLGIVKVLFETTHINKRYFNTWSARAVVPPALVHHLTSPAPVAEVAIHAENVLSKTLRLVDLLKRSGIGSQLGSNPTRLLPEPELLQFLLVANQMTDVRTLIQDHDVPPRLTLYDDLVWPVQTDYVPYNTFQQASTDEMLIPETAPLDHEEHRSESIEKEV